MKRLLDIILRLSHYNVKIVFGNKFVYFVLSAVIFYILTVVINLFPIRRLRRRRGIICCWYRPYC